MTRIKTALIGGVVGEEQMVPAKDRDRQDHRQLAADLAVRKALQEMWFRPKRRLHRQNPGGGASGRHRQLAVDLAVRSGAAS